MRLITENYSTYFNSLPDDKKVIVEDYQGVAGPYDRLWKEIDLRTEKAEWKIDGRGVGVCDLTFQTSDHCVLGPAASQIIKLRELRNKETSFRQTQVASCNFHRPGKGCCLGDLKPEKCLYYVNPELNQEIQEIFDLNLLSLRMALRRVFKEILLGGKNSNGLVKEWVDQINQVTEVVLKYDLVGEPLLARAR